MDSGSAESSTWTPTSGYEPKQPRKFSSHYQRVNTVRYSNTTFVLTEIYTQTSECERFCFHVARNEPFCPTFGLNRCTWWPARYSCWQVIIQLLIVWFHDHWTERSPLKWIIELGTKSVQSSIVLTCLETDQSPKVTLFGVTWFSSRLLLLVCLKLVDFTSWDSLEELLHSIDFFSRSPSTIESFWAESFQGVSSSLSSIAHTHTNKHFKSPFRYFGRNVLRLCPFWAKTSVAE